MALSRDEQTLFVAETGRYRIWKIAPSRPTAWTSTAGKAQASVLLDNLPGYPDNLMRGMDDKIWLGFSGPRSADVDAMAGKPFLRKLTPRLPRMLWPLPKTYGHVFAFTEDGPWWPTCRTQRETTRRPPASRKPPTGSTCRTCVFRPSAGGRADAADQRANCIRMG